MKPKLGLDPEQIERGRALAAQIAAPVQQYIDRHTTDSVERTTLRMMGIDGVDGEGVPIPNLIVNALRQKLDEGVAKTAISALLQTGLSVAQFNRAVADGFDVTAVSLSDQSTIAALGAELVDGFERRVAASVTHRQAKLTEYKGNMGTPLLYVICATGNIYEDVKQARAAARQGADVIAVIRTTAQSLLDYVPYGATTEGFGGTYATQENFRIMRLALDEVGDEVGRYIRLVNYASGLCMPEIAVMGAFERLDMMLNDSMYGVLFRDINMYRTFVDQNFSRMISGFADIVINTGEDNYLTTSDAVEKAYTVLASQFLNEQFALNANMPPQLMGLGHAFEMNPNIENGFLLELAQAQMIREIFPLAPLKYMPPTKYMSGDIFKGYAMNTLFNFVAKATGQGILLLGMLTEAVHTPFMQDRYLAIENAKYVMNTIGDFMSDIEFKSNGIMQTRAQTVLNQTVGFLTEVNDTGLFDAITHGAFADVKRSPNGGKGFDGVVEKGPGYWNPFYDFLTNRGTRGVRSESC